MRNGNDFEDRRIKTKTLNRILLAAVGVLAAVAVFAVVFKFLGGSKKPDAEPAEEIAEAVDTAKDQAADYEDLSDLQQIATSENADIATDTAADNSEDAGNIADTEESTEAETGSDTEENAETEAGTDTDPEEDIEGSDTGAQESAAVSEKTLIPRVEELIEEMSVHAKICQMFVVYPSALTGVKKVTEAGNMTKNALDNYPVGGFIYNASNMDSYSQVHSLLTGVQKFSEIPMILTCDEEGGRVERLMSNVGTTQVGAMYNYRKEGTETAYDNAFVIASDMKTIGMNMDLAPVADVWSNPENTVIGDRAYSDDFEEAAALVAEAVKGFHDGGVACTLKHFPGHGDTTADTHYDTAVVTKTLEELRNEEFLPFKAGIDAGADAVMIGHLIVPDISDEPAVFSKEIVTDILRGELGFDGVVITDALEMGAIANNYTSADAALKCVEAGVDIILCPGDFSTAIRAIKDAVARGDIEEERIDESVRRILTLKYNNGML